MSDINEPKNIFAPDLFSVRYPPINYNEFLKDICLNNKDLTLKLINIFLNERSPEFLKEVTDAVDAKDGKRIRTICHTISGTAANICATQLSEHAKELGQLANNGETEKYNDVLEHIKEIFLAIEEWGEKYIKENS